MALPSIASATSQYSFPTSAAFNFQQDVVLTTGESDRCAQPLHRIPMTANGLEVRTLRWLIHVWKWSCSLNRCSQTEPCGSLSPWDCTTAIREEDNIQWWSNLVTLVHWPQAPGSQWWTEPKPEQSPAASTDHSTAPIGLYSSTRHDGCIYAAIGPLEEILGLNVLANTSHGVTGWWPAHSRPLDETKLMWSWQVHSVCVTMYVYAKEPWAFTLYAKPCWLPSRPFREKSRCTCRSNFNNSCFKPARPFTHGQWEEIKERSDFFISLVAAGVYWPCNDSFSFWSATTDYCVCCHRARLPRTKAAMKQRTILVARFVSLLSWQLNLAPWLHLNTGEACCVFTFNDN